MTNPQHHEPEAPVYVCREGILIPYNTLHGKMLRSWRSMQDKSVSEADGLLVPRCRTRDALRAQPPLSIKLTSPEIKALILAEACGQHAASFFGPPQDKADNEDFALAAALSTPSNVPCFMAAVADGVSTRTFWPQRAARLACLGALRVFARHAHNGASTDESAIKTLRIELTSTLHHLLSRDRRSLLRRQFVPPDWRPDVYRRHVKKLEYWYNSTLIIAFATPAATILFWTGDGGIAIAKHYHDGPIQNSQPLQSTSDLTVTNVVSLTKRIRFSAGRIAASTELNRITVTLCTDGPDRTRQRANISLEPETLPGSAALLAQLQRMAASPKAEIDNYSAAILSSPHSASIPRAAKQTTAVLAKRLTAQNPAPASSPQRTRKRRQQPRQNQNERKPSP